MGKVIYLEEYFAKKYEENMQNERRAVTLEDFVEYPVAIPESFGLPEEELQYMKESNGDIPLWMRRMVNKITRYFYPNAGEERRFLIWELRKDIYNFFGYNWYSPMDMHPERYFWDCE